MRIIYAGALPPGDAGPYTTVAHMQAMARAASVDPVVRAQAVALVRYWPGLSASWGTWHAEEIKRWVHEHLTYVPDPTYYELLHDPAAAIRQIQQTGFFAGDCDDIALVAAALGLAVGLEARYVLIALRPSDPWHHILTELRGGSREPWIAIDPSRPVGGAYLPARTVAIPI